MAGKKYGLDLGSDNIRICQLGKGLVINEKNMIAVQKKKIQVAAGNDAYEMFERTPASIRIVRPVRDGVIADIQNMNKVTEALLKKSGATTGFLHNNSFLFAVPSDCTEVEKRAYYDLIAHSIFNTHQISIVEKPLAAAIGERLPVNGSTAIMLVDMGAGCTEITIMVKSGIVISKLLRKGGDTINANIQKLTKERYHLIIGEKTAEYLKLELGCAIPGKHVEVMAYGRDQVTGLPAKLLISSELVFEAMKDYLVEVMTLVHDMMQKIPHEYASDIITGGVHFTGGTSQIPELKKLLEKLLKVKVNFSDKPQQSTVRGLNMIMDRAADFKDMTFSLREATFE